MKFFKMDTNDISQNEIDEIEEFEISNHIQSLIKDDPFLNTPYEGYYYLNPGQKGTVGEFIQRKLYTKANFYSLDRDNAGHDFILDLSNYDDKEHIYIKNETKFSLLKPEKNSSWMINHIALKKDWQILTITLVDYFNNHTKYNYVYNKETVSKMIDDSVFKYQQGGKSGENDDFMLSIKPKELKKVLESYECVTTLDKYKIRQLLGIN